MELKDIKNPIIRKALQKREADFIFNYGDHTDHNDKHSDYKDYSEYGDHTDHTERYSDCDSGYSDSYGDHTD